MAGVAILLIIFCVGIFAVLTWFAVTLTSKNRVSNLVNGVLNSCGEGDDRLLKQMHKHTHDPVYSHRAGNIWADS